MDTNSYRIEPQVEYEDLPVILTIEEAIEANSFFEYDRRMKKGKPIEEAFKESDYVFEGTTRMGGQEHFYLGKPSSRSTAMRLLTINSETQGCIVLPKLEDGEMEVFSSTQALMETQVILCI